MSRRPLLRTITTTIGACVAMTVSLAAGGLGALAPSASGAATWTPVSALPSGSSTTGAQAVGDPAGGSLLFYVLNSTPTIAAVASRGTVGSSASVPAVANLDNVGTPGRIAFLSTGAAIVTWTLTAYGSEYMAYRSPTGTWGKPVELPSGFSNLAVRSTEVLTSEASSTGISTESWSLSGSGALTVKSGPTNVYTGDQLFNTSWLALDPGGTAELVVLGSTDDGNTEAVSAATRSATGVWSAQTQLSASGLSVQSAVFATAPGGRSILNWVTGNTALAAASYTALRLSGHGFGAAVATGSVSSTFGAFIQAIAAAGADGTLAVTLTEKVYTSDYVFNTTTSVHTVAPTATVLGGSVSVPQAVLPESLGADHSEVIVGSVVSNIGAGNPSYPSSYTDKQQVFATIIGPGSTTISHQLGSSSGTYDGNGGDGCPCPQSPPVASIIGVALDPAGNGVAVGQLTPGGALESARYVVVTAPGAPGSLKATSGNAKVTLTWTAPTADGGSAITGYDVYQGTTSGGEGSKPVNASPLSSTARSYTRTALKNGTRYYFTVKAINAAGVGAASSQASAIPATVPGAPGSLKAAPGNAKITISWTTPTSNGGSAITGYDVYEGTKSAGEGSKPVNTSPLSSTTRSYTRTGLKNGTRYYFTVKAINAVGIGAASNQASTIPVA
ncbi:MAG: fibronectin type III domain-containing protein [Acidimicrobiales bacterium]|jgi:hypothetical protein